MLLSDRVWLCSQDVIHCAVEKLHSPGTRSSIDNSLKISTLMGFGSHFPSRQESGSS